MLRTWFKFLIPHFRTRQVLLDYRRKDLVYLPQTRDELERTGLDAKEYIAQFAGLPYLRLVQLCWLGRIWFNHCQAVGFCKE